VLCLAAGPVALRADVAVHRQIAPSTVAIYGPDLLPYGGCGVLVDVKRRWIVTADHLVRLHVHRGVYDVNVVFAQVLDGKVVTDLRHYKRNLRPLAIPGRIILNDLLRDLAVIELQKLPANVQAVSLAGEDPQPGEMIHIIGNSTAMFGGAFGYNCGHVRNSFFWVSHPYVRYTLSHQAPTNKGDSGGPIVNNKGELVALVSEGTTGEPGKKGQWTYQQQVVDHSAHVREIRHVLTRLKGSPFQSPSGQTLVHRLTSAPRSGFDDFVIPVTRGQPVEVKLQGDGKANLDLWMVDDTGKLVDRKDGPTDQEETTLNPDWSGLCKVRVVNINGAVDRYTLSIKWTQPVHGEFLVVRGVEQQTTDVLQLAYQAGRKARLKLLGDGDTDLDIAVHDPAGKQVAVGNGPTDSEEVAWQAETTGVYTVRITNKGTIWNQYVLTTD
jgi:hypothetical protein